MDDKIINELADRLGKLTVVDLVDGETGPLERYVRRAELVRLARVFMLTAATKTTPADAKAIAAIVGELSRARKSHGKFPSLHHALGVVREEYKEFEEKVFERDVDRGAVAVECVQLGAMAVRTLTDLGLTEHAR